jgi:hypothetical protein
MPAGITVHELEPEPRWDPLRRDPHFQRLLTRHAVVSEGARR